MAAVFIDFTKAFDTISHTCLIRKLHSVGISDISLNWYKDFLSQRQQRVVINGVASDWLSVTRGVPQGSLLGPLLFSIYVNDMPSVVRSAVLNMYADDTTVYTTGKCPTHVAQCLTNELEHLSTWCQANHLRINPAKTAAMFLCRRGLQRCGSAKIYLEGHPLENKSVTDYLGVTIDSQLTFRQHVARVTSKAYGALKTLCHVKASLPTVTRILLYRTLVLPHLEYCSAIWDPHTAELTSKVERVQNRAMRYILDRPPRTSSDSLRQQLKWQTLEERRKFHRAKLTYRILKELAPTYLHGKFHKNSEIGRAGGRNADNIYVIRPNTNWVKNSFHYRATLTWNSLDPSIKRATSLSLFSRLYKRLMWT